MSVTIPIEEAQANLSALLAGLAPGDEVLITQDERLVARLIAESPAVRRPRRPGSAQGRLLILAEDDEHLADFRDYLPS